MNNSVRVDEAESEDAAQRQASIHGRLDEVGVDEKIPWWAPKLVSTRDKWTLQDKCWVK
jgi:hypothetical protein